MPCVCMWPNTMDLGSPGNTILLIKHLESDFTSALGKHYSSLSMKKLTQSLIGLPKVSKGVRQS